MPKSDQVIQSKKYQVIPRTLIFIFDEAQHVLLIKGSEDKKRWANIYNGIGGHIEAGENILEGAWRELAEETGLTDIPLQLCGQIMVDVSDDLGIALFIFRGFTEGHAVQSSEEGELFWASMDLLKGLPIVEDLPILIPKALNYQAGEPLFIGKSFYSEDDCLMIELV